MENINGAILFINWRKKIFIILCYFIAKYFIITPEPSWGAPIAKSNRNGGNLNDNSGRNSTTYWHPHLV
jgi:hypothetical protein